MVELNFEKLREMLLYHKIVKWSKNTIVLDSGLEVSVEETEQDCCAHAYCEFMDVVLDAAITNVSDIKYEPWEDDDTYGCSATMTIMHNQNIICKALADADAGNGGYYYSIASFVVKIPGLGDKACHFVASEDGREV